MEDPERSDEIVDELEQDESELFDVQAWAEAYHADDERDAKYPPQLAGVPFH